MGFFAKIVFGNALTKLTNLEEELAKIRRVAGVSESESLDLLPASRHKELDKKVSKWIDTLRSQPSHIVTRELMKNIQINQRIGRERRIDAQINLLKRLVSLGIAMDPDDFVRIYLR